MNTRQALLPLRYVERISFAQRGTHQTLLVIEAVHAADALYYRKNGLPGVDALERTLSAACRLAWIRRKDATLKNASILIFQSPDGMSPFSLRVGDA